MSQPAFAVNLGGEGEIPGILNQQPPGAAGPNWFSRNGKTLLEMIRDGHPFLICANDAVALPAESVDTVYTNNVPVDITSTLGPGVQTFEIKRILKPGGVWIRDGAPYYTKP
jgi:hypothetical protein